MTSLAGFFLVLVIYTAFGVASAEVREETIRLDKNGVAAIAVHPQNPQVLYCGDRRGRLYKSLDRGADWVQLNIGSVGFDLLDEVSAIVVDPRVPERVYFRKHNTVFLSTDGGETGATIISTGQEHMPLVLSLHPQLDSVVYVGTDTGLVRTKDGKLWENVLREKVYALAFSALSPNKVYAVGTSIFFSNDGGATWKESHVAHQDQIFAFSSVVVAPHNPEVAYVGVLMECGVKIPGIIKTEDGGSNWFSSGLDSIAVKGIAIEGSGDRIIYAGGGTKVNAGGVFWSQDGGTSWSKVYEWPTALTIVLDSLSSHLLYVGTTGSMLRYTFEIE